MTAKPMPFRFVAVRTAPHKRTGLRTCGVPAFRMNGPARLGYLGLLATEPDRRNGCGGTSRSRRSFKPRYARSTFPQEYMSEKSSGEVWERFRRKPIQYLRTLCFGERVTPQSSLASSP